MFGGRTYKLLKEHHPHPVKYQKSSIQLFLRQFFWPSCGVATEQQKYIKFWSRRLNKIQIPINKPFHYQYIVVSATLLQHFISRCIYCDDQFPRNTSERSLRSNRTAALLKNNQDPPRRWQLTGQQSSLQSHRLYNL